MEEVDIERIEDYRQFVPAQLSGEFTVKEFAKAAHIPKELGGTVVHILTYVGVLQMTGKQGNAYVYEIAQPELINPQ